MPYFTDRPSSRGPEDRRERPHSAAGYEGYDYHGRGDYRRMYSQEDYYRQQQYDDRYRGKRLTVLYGIILGGFLSPGVFAFEFVPSVMGFRSNQKSHSPQGQGSRNFIGSVLRL